MTKKVVLIYLLTLFTLHTSCLLSAQNDDSKHPLNEVLKDLEAKFNCSFSYSDEDVVSLQIVKPTNTFSFLKTIEYLENATGLVFNVLEGKTITIMSPLNAFVSICGSLTDSETNEAVQDAYIRSKTGSVVSDTKGNFRFDDIALNDTLIVNHIAYSKLKIPVTLLTKRPCAIITLNPDEKIFEEVLVKGYLTRGINKNTNGQLSFDFKKFGILPGVIENDALQAVSTLPGIQSLNETVTNINIRGGSHDQNLVLWDGIKMYQTGHFFSLISAFNPYVAPKVTLTKNATSVSLTDGVSGTISMNSTENVRDEIKGALGLNLINAYGYIDVPLSEKLSLTLAARRSYSDLAKTQTFKKYFEKAFQNTEIIQNRANVIEASDNFIFYDFNAILNYKISSKDYLKASFIGMKNSLSFLESAFINNREESRESSTSQNNVSAGILYSRQWNSKLASTFFAHGTKYVLGGINVNILQDQRLKQENKVEESSIKFNTVYTPNDRVEFNAGYDFIETGISNLEDTDLPLYQKFSKDVIRQHAIYSELNYKFQQQNAQLTIGGRLNYLDPLDQFIVEPRLNFNIRFLDFFSWDLKGEFKNQTTTQIIDFQKDFLGVENRRWIAANDNDVPVIKSKQISSGITFQNRGWLVNTEFYLKEVNGITAQSQGFTNQFERMPAIGSYMVHGVDVLLHKKIKRVDSWLSYSFATNDYRFSSFQEQIFPSNFDIRHTVKAGVNYTLKNFKISAGVTWFTGKPSTRPIPGNEVSNNNINFEAPNSTNLNDYFRLDTSLTYDFFLSPKVKATGGIALWNLTNYSSELTNYYRFTDINFPEEVVENSLEFTPNVTFRISF